MNLSIFSGILIIFGALVLIVSMIHIRAILEIEKGQKYHVRWRILFFLVLFFMIFYVIAAALIFMGYESVLILLTGIVFFAGALFTVMVAGTSYRTLLDLRKPKSEEG